jgi:Mg-chelatase subunit ChlD
MRMIAAIDVSGSMARPAGDQSRIELARGAALTALTTFPRATEVGLWVFSTDRGPGRRDWQRLAPIRRLDAEVGSTTHQEVLTQALTDLPARPKGDTGLYDTVLAASRAVRKGYDPDRVNSVVLLTDGINDDPSGITLDKLVATLRKEQVPDRPVRVILVGMGPEADAATLATIARATDGASYVARDPKDITTVFVQALLSRG